MAKPEVSRAVRGEQDAARRAAPGRQPPVRAVDRVCDALRRAILGGVFAPGSRLDLRALARDLNVSATPLRSAIQTLRTAGFVELGAHGGTFVMAVSVEDVAETFDVRRALECLAVETGVQYVTNEALVDLRRLLDRMKRCVSAEEHGRDNATFHRALVQLSRNQQLLKLYDELDAHLHIAHIHGVRGQWRLRVTEEHEEHLEMLHALEARDAAALASALTRHIDRAKHALIRSLRSSR